MKYSGYGTVQRHRTSNSGDVCLTLWHTNLSRCKKFADDNGLPMVAVWSNGVACGHCCTFVSAISNSTFVNFQKKYKVVWCFVESGDSDGARESGVAYNWCGGFPALTRKSAIKMPEFFPFVNFYWKKANMDVCVTGDSLNKQKGGSAGAKSVVSKIKSRFASAFKKYKYDPNA